MCPGQKTGGRKMTGLHSVILVENKNEICITGRLKGDECHKKVPF